MEHQFKIGDKVRLHPDTPFAARLETSLDDVGTVVRQKPGNKFDEGLGVDVTFPSWLKGNFPLAIREKYLILVERGTEDGNV